MKVIGVTGGVATGKTTVARILSSFLKASIIDADEIVHKLLRPGEDVWQRVIGVFGREILKEDLSIDRKKLSQIVFSNPNHRRKVESIVHPEVKRIMREELKHLESSGENAVVMDIPLLFEAKMESMVDVIIVVVRDEHRQLETLQQERNLSINEAKKRIKSQIPLSEKVRGAHFVVDNNGRLQETKRQVKEICVSIRRCE